MSRPTLLPSIALLLVVASASALLACGVQEPSPRAEATDTGGGAGTGDDATPAFECAAGQQTCDCPDGTHTGLQLCSPEDGLAPCSCLAQAAPAGMPMEATPAAPRLVEGVCPELAGNVGCDARSYESKELPSSILFLIDRSGSMACNPPPVQSVEDCNAMPIAKDPMQPSRWQVTVAALKEALSNLKDTDASAGLTFFSVDSMCGVNSTPNVGVNAITEPQLDAFNLALDALEPRGGTPIVGAVVLGYSHLHQEIMAPGNRYVVLLTDGEESCGFAGDGSDIGDVYKARKHLLEVEVSKAREANIRTFVIGAPGSEKARGFLSELAFQGGTARRPECEHGDMAGDVGDCHYDLTKDDDFAAVLREALGEVSGQALGCEFATPDGVSTRVNVQYRLGGDAAPTCLTQAASCDAMADGWQFGKLADGSDDLSKVVLCGAACDRVKDNPEISVDVILGCAPVE
jgi:hypothetical protein